MTLGSHPALVIFQYSFVQLYNNSSPSGESDLPTCLLFFNHWHLGLLGMPERSHQFQEESMHGAFVVLAVSMCC